MTDLTLSKIPQREMPKPEKRRGFTARQVAAVFIKCDGRCAACGVKVQLDGYQIDHIQRIDALGKHELENWQLLCLPCHAAKTRIDNREAKHGARVRGETGQRARRAANGPQLKGRKFERPEGYRHQWPKRKFRSGK